MVVQLLPHQEKAVGELSNGKVLVGGVGTGKTVTALAYYFTEILGGILNDFGSIKTPTDLYIFTTARKRDDHDWQTWAAKLGISTKKEYSLHGIQLIVDSYNNIDKYTDIKDSFVILDEQRLVGSGAWSRAFIKIAKSNQWIMLSATPGDTWLDYIPLFIANGFYKNRTEFKRDHCVYSYFGRYPKLERYISTGKLVRLRNSILVEMPYQKHTTRHIHEIDVDYDKELFKRVVKDRWHVYENRPLRDVSELFSVMRKVVNTDASRIQSLIDIFSEHPRLIVFYNFDYELEMLRTLSQDSSLTSIPSKSTTSQRQNLESMAAFQRSIQTSNISNGETTNHQKILPITSSRMLETSKSNIQDLTRNLTEREKCRNTDPKLVRSNSSYSTMEKSSSDSPGMENGSNRHIGTYTSFQLLRLQTEIEEEVCQIQKPVDTTLSDVNSPNPNRSEFISKSIKRDTAPGSIRLSKSYPNPKSETTEKKSSIWMSWSNGSKTNSELFSLPNNENYSSGDFVDSQHESVDVQSQTSESNATSLSDIVQIAEWNGHKHEPVPNCDRWIYLVQYVAGAEAWNCTATNSVIFFSLTYSFKNFAQAQGRIDRLDTPFSDLHYYVLKSDSVIDKGVWQALKEKKTFNERNFLVNT